MFASTGVVWTTALFLSVFRCKAGGWPCPCPIPPGSQSSKAGMLCQFVKTNKKKKKKNQAVIWACMLSCIQLCLTLCDPMDYSPPGSSVHRDSPGENIGVGCHALLLLGSSQPRDQTQVSCISGGFFTIQATREVPFANKIIYYYFLLIQNLK